MHHPVTEGTMVSLNAIKLTNFNPVGYKVQSEVKFYAFIPVRLNKTLLLVLLGLVLVQNCLSDITFLRAEKVCPGKKGYP